MLNPNAPESASSLIYIKRPQGVSNIRPRKTLKGLVTGLNYSLQGFAEVYRMTS